jgi:hypothetical protein
LGDKAWWLWIVVPLYSVWLGYTTVMGVRSGIKGLGKEGQEVGVAESKRQKKLEKRGGQRVKYR